MVDVCNNAEVPESFDWDLLNAPLEVRLHLCGLARDGGVEAMLE
jgi:hypothetical protein